METIATIAWRHVLELHHLRYLRSVVRTGSVTAAAEAEYVAQPSVSKQLRALERELGVPLFHRVGRRVVPTAAAIALADCAGRVFEDIESTIAAVSGPESARGGTLAICATETVSDHLLPAAITELRQRHPRSTVSVEMLGTADAVTRLLSDEFDLAILVLPLVDSRLEIHPFLVEEVLLAVPPGHPWATRAQVPMAEALAERSLVLSMPGLGLRALVDAAAAASGILLEHTLQLRSQQAILSIVASGGGIAFVPRMAVAKHAGVATVPLDPPLWRELGWVRRRGRHLPAIASELLALVGVSELE